MNKIEWVKDPSTNNPDQKLVMVDGVAWAATICSHHSRYGNSYEFRQIGGDMIERSLPSIRPGTHNFTRVGVWSFSENPNRNRDINGERHGNTAPDMRPTEQRIIDTARELIEEGLLRDPAIVRVENDARKEKSRDARKAAEKERDNLWREKAKEAYSYVQSGQPDQIIDAILDAMKWAQSQ